LLNNRGGSVLSLHEAGPLRRIDLPNGDYIINELSRYPCGVN